MISDQNLQTYDLKTQLRIKKIQEEKMMFPIELSNHRKSVNMVAFNKSCTLLASCSDAGEIKIHNGLDYSLLNSIQVTEMAAAIKFIYWTQDSKKIIGACTDCVYIIDPYKLQFEQIIILAVHEDFRAMDFKLSFTNDSFGVIWRYMFGASELQKDQTFNEIAIYEMKDFMRSIEPLLIKQKEIDEMQTESSSNAEKTEEKKSIFKSVKLTNPKFKISKKDFEYLKFEFYADSKIVFCSRQQSVLEKYDLNVSAEKPILTYTLKSKLINNLQFSPKFEFLLCSCNDSISLIDPENLEIFHSVTTKYPVLSAKINYFMYHDEPKYHLIYAGGIPAVDQATTNQGGNEIYLYDFAKNQELTKLGGAYGNINYIDLFKDGSGIITAGGEGIIRVYRFDMSFYKDKKKSEEKEE